MVKTASTMLPLGSPLPPFALRDTLSGDRVSRESLPAGQPVLVVFMCNHCPFVVHIREVLVSFANEYVGRGLKMIAISSNDVSGYPQDGPDRMTEEGQKYGFPFAYLFDEQQEAAKAFKAACTPDFFLFDAQHQLVYRGQFDDSRPSNGKPVTGADLRAACDALLSGQPVSVDQKPSIGCNIKWKPDGAPDYFTGQPALVT